MERNTDTVSLSTARRAVEYEAEQRFPDNEWTLIITEWNDGDFKVKAQHGDRQTDAENNVREEIICTPFQMEFRVVEISQSEEGMVLYDEVLENDE